MRKDWRLPALWAVALLLAAWFAVTMIGRAREARRERAAVAASAGTVAPRWPAGAAIVAGDADAADGVLGRIVADRGSRAGVRLATLPGGAGGEDMVRLRIVARGPEPALRRYALALETGAPAIRLLRWRLAAEAGGARLEAEAAAPWRRP